MPFLPPVSPFSLPSPSLCCNPKPQLEVHFGEECEGGSQSTLCVSGSGSGIVQLEGESLINSPGAGGGVGFRPDSKLWAILSPAPNKWPRAESVASCQHTAPLPVLTVPGQQLTSHLSLATTPCNAGHVTESFLFGSF